MARTVEHTGHSHRKCLHMQAQDGGADAGRVRELQGTVHQLEAQVASLKAALEAASAADSGMRGGRPVHSIHDSSLHTSR